MSWETCCVWRRPPSGDAESELEAVPFLQLRVQDTGKGMDEAGRRAMFMPFFTTKHGKSRGLGLTLVYEVVRDLGGFIEVASSPDAGTCMDLYFPVCPVADSHQSGNYHNPETPIFQGDGPRPQRWLVVDEDSKVRLRVQELLAEQGMEAATAASGEEALIIYRQSGTGITGVILDLALSDMPGEQVLNGLREINPQVRVIIATGAPRQHMGAVKGCMLLAKPFNLQDLKLAIGQSQAA
ncbi:MAG: response regulator [SAR202 cluster bacterium]|nr:response regulator [SAR202 cluster bacterium]